MGASTVVIVERMLSQVRGAHLFPTPRDGAFVVNRNRRRDETDPIALSRQPYRMDKQEKLKAARKKVNH